MRSSSRLLALVVSTFAAALFASACTADVDEGCLGGNCVPPGNPPVPPPWSTSGAGGSGGGADAGSCQDTTDTGDFPCDVFAVLQANCHTCHTSPPMNNAPFPLLTYEDTQAPFGADRQRWQRMAEVVESGFMPLGKVLPAADKQTLLDWLGQCAPPAPDGMGCE